MPSSSAQQQPEHEHREERLLIGEVARRAGLAVSAVRYYEQVGVIASVGRRAGQRVFSADVAVRLRAVQLAQRAGFTLAEIRVLLGSSGGEEDFGRLLRSKLQQLRDRRVELDAAERMLVASLQAGACDLDVCSAAAVRGADVVPSPGSS